MFVKSTNIHQKLQQLLINLNQSKVVGCYVTFENWRKMQLGYNATRFVKSQAKKVIDTKVKGDVSRANYSEISKIILFFISTVDEDGQSQMMVILLMMFFKSIKSKMRVWSTSKIINMRYANMPKLTGFNSLLQLISTCEIFTKKLVCVSSKVVPILLISNLIT